MQCRRNITKNIAIDANIALSFETENNLFFVLFISLLTDEQRKKNENFRHTIATDSRDIHVNLILENQ